MCGLVCSPQPYLSLEPHQDSQFRETPSILGPRCAKQFAQSLVRVSFSRAAFSIGWGEGGALSELVIIPSQITIKIKNKLHFR